MTEKHPFGFYIPNNARYILLGSFPGKLDDNYNWFYCSKRGQFWKIVSKVYDIDLESKQSKIDLMNSKGIVMGDVIKSCERSLDNNSDQNLDVKEYHQEEISQIINSNNISKIFFTSRFVENIFRRHFSEIINKYPEIKLITLPSPSPRYAKLSIDSKIQIYKTLLPE